MSAKQAMAIGGTILAAVGLATLIVSEAGSERSENQALVERDPSWLGYLPVPLDGVEPIVTTMNEADSTTKARRVDLILEPSQDDVSLCFSATRQEADEACGGGTQLLGRMHRDVELPWVSLIGETEVNLLDHLDGPTPTLDDVPSLEG